MGPRLRGDGTEVVETPLSQIRHCEERSDEAIRVSACGTMDCFAEPVIGPRFARTRWLAKMGWTAPDGISVPE
jgi:hypothetical protein